MGKIALNTRAAKFQDTAQKAGRWLCSCQNEDGSIGTPFGVGGLYKTVWALEATGHLQKASRLSQCCTLRPLHFLMAEIGGGL